MNGHVKPAIVLWLLYQDSKLIFNNSFVSFPKHDKHKHDTSTSLFYVYLYVIITSTTCTNHTTSAISLCYTRACVRVCIFSSFFFCFVSFLPFFLFMLILLLLTPFSHLLLSTICPYFLPYVFFSLSICLCLAATCWYHLDTMFPRCPSMCFANLMRGFAAWKHTSLPGRRVPYESLPSTLLPQSSLCRFKSKLFGSTFSIILARSAVSTSKLFHFYLSMFFPYLGYCYYNIIHKML